MTEEEAAKIIADGDYWEAWAKKLGMRVSGFSWRETANFVDENHEVIHVTKALITSIEKAISEAEANCLHRYSSEESW